MSETKKLSKLSRSETNKVIAGICGGFGDYFDIDPVILRIIFVFMAVFGGGGVILYIILWIVIPSKSKLGKKSEEYIKENVEEIKNISEKVSKNSNTKVFGGIILILLGTSLLFQNLGFYSFNFIWKFWPLAIVALGLVILTKDNN